MGVAMERSALVASVQKNAQSPLNVPIASAVKMVAVVWNAPLVSYVTAKLGQYVVNIFKCFLSLILLFLHVSNSMRCHMFNSLELAIAYAGPNSMRCFS